MLKRQQGQTKTRGLRSLSSVSYLCGFFGSANQYKEKTQETEPTVHHPYPRKFDHLAI